MRRAIILAFALLIGSAAFPAYAEGTDFYRITTLRAAPGSWIDLKALIEGQGEAGSVSADGRNIPYRIRHSQGAQWDFMLIQPVADFSGYFGEKTQSLESDFRSEVAKLADFEEDWFVSGPAHQGVKDAYADTGMFLVEMFRARAGMKAALADSRVRENGVLEAIGVPSNFVFVGEFGADWDVMTIGFHESLATYAVAGNETSADDGDKAARDFGFQAMGTLAPELRELLTQHNDTIARALD